MIGACITLSIQAQGGLYMAKPFEGHQGSVYALALNEAGNFLVAGSTEGVIRISDTRSNTMAASLKGHTENIRLVLSAACSSVVMQNILNVILYNIIFCVLA